MNTKIPNYLFVSKNGKSLNLEKDISSFSTIQEALNAIREMRLKGFNLPISVYLMDEKYYLDEPIEIVGLNDITFLPDNKNNVLISGGKRIENFKKDTFNGVDCWSSYLDEVKNGKWYFTSLYVNEKHAERPRYPKEGFLYPVEVENPSDTNMFVKSSWFKAAENDIKKEFSHLDEGVVVFSHYWLNERIRIKKFDKESNIVELSAKTRMTISSKKNESSSMPYYIENVPEAFGKKGEFYLSIDDGKLYYIPRDNESIENTEVVAPYLDNICNIRDSSNINFSNIIFSHAKGDYIPKLKIKDELNNEKYIDVGSDAQAAVSLFGAINFYNSNSSIVKDCKVCCNGTYGIKVFDGSHHIGIINTEIHEGCGGGVSIVGSESLDDASNQTHDIKVFNCNIHDLGNRYYASVGVLITHAYNCEILNNEIYNLNYTGVSCGWTWGYAKCIESNNLISKNHIHHIGTGVLSDMGGIYTLGAQNGTVVSNNIVHDVFSRDYGAWGIYADEGSSNIVYENNICYNVENGFHQNYGKMNIVRNNIFANYRVSAIKITEIQPFVGIIASNNIFYSKKGTWLYDRFVSMHCPSPDYLKSDNNLIYFEDEEVVTYDENGKIIDINIAKDKYGWDNNSLIKDPLFVDAKNNNFKLKDNSLIKETSFIEFDIDSIGNIK